MFIHRYMKSKNILLESKDIDQINTPKELNKFLNKFDYGFIINGKKVDAKNGNDYRSLSPSDFIKYRCGVCWDYCAYENYWFKNHKYETKLYFMCTNRCTATHTFLIFKEGGIDIVNPYSEDIDVKFQMNNINSYSGNYHGFLPGLFAPVTSLIGRGINGLRNIIKENRSQANSTYAYSTLGKDGYEKHKDIINSNSTMKKGKFKKFIDGLKQMENSINSHGLCPSCGQDDGKPEEIAEFATFDDLNLKPFVQSYPAELADYEYKNQLTLDYKNRFNLEKLRLNSFGSECAMDANNYHGRVGDWFRRVGNKFRGWFKNDVGTV